MTGAVFLTPGLVVPCARLICDAYAPPPWQEVYSLPQLESYLGKFLNRPECLALVWLEADVPAALALGCRVPGMDADYLRLEEFCAWPQGAGSGGKLLEALCHEVRKRGMDSVLLNTIRDVPARKFYEKHGFRLLADSVCLFRGLEEGETNQ